MPRDRGDEAYLRDMLDAARRVATATERMTLTSFEQDQVIRYAVHRWIEIIGEAAKHVSAELKDKHPEIPWSKIIRQRHRLAHDYDDIDDELIWSVVTVHIPVLIQHLEHILPAPPEQSA